MSRGGVVDSHARERVEHPGEIIEERRKDAEGRIGTYKYLKGKMLGKVSRMRCLTIVLSLIGVDLAIGNANSVKIVE